MRLRALSENLRLRLCLKFDIGVGTPFHIQSFTSRRFGFPPACMKLGAELGGRLPEDAFEHAIKLSERLEADVVSDFADAAAWIQELSLCIFQPNPRDVVGELQARGFFEHFAEVKDAGAGGLGDGGE